MRLNEGRVKTIKGDGKGVWFRRGTYVDQDSWRSGRQLDVRLRGAKVAEEEETGERNQITTSTTANPRPLWIVSGTRAAPEGFYSRYQLSTPVTEHTSTMRSACFCLLLLLPWCVRAQRRAPPLPRFGEDTRTDKLAADTLNGAGVLDSLLRSQQQQQQQQHAVLRHVRAPRPAAQVPKRAQQGSRFALSLDVPTSILSVLIDLAKNQDMRTKAAANAELMARIGRRK